MFVTQINECQEYEFAAPHTRRARVIFDQENLTGAAASMIEIVMREGEFGPEHMHDDAVEVYYCTGGRGTTTVDGREVVLTEGTVLYVHPGERHQTFNAGPEDFRIVCFFTPAVSWAITREQRKIEPIRD